MSVNRLSVAMVAFVVINWTLLFRPAYDGEPVEIKRSIVFHDKIEAKRFYDHKPEGIFECIDPFTATHGFCEVKNVDFEIKGE